MYYWFNIEGRTFMEALIKSFDHLAKSHKKNNLLDCSKIYKINEKNI